jgi:hypothetical protein
MLQKISRSAAMSGRKFRNGAAQFFQGRVVENASDNFKTVAI